MQNRIESQALIVKIENQRSENKVAGTGDWQKLRQSLNDAQYNDLNQFHVFLYAS
jgi:hypothetical protein